MAYTPRPMDEVLASVRKGTRGAVRRTSQEEVEAARVKAAGRAPREVSPEFHAWAKAETESRARRAVMGLISVKGRQPLHVLSEEQFDQFRRTGAWEGMPTPEEYGPQHYVPDDKEYT